MYLFICFMFVCLFFALHTCMLPLKLICHVPMPSIIFLYVLFIVHYLLVYVVDLCPDTHSRFLRKVVFLCFLKVSVQ